MCAFIIYGQYQLCEGIVRLLYTCGYCADYIVTVQRRQVYMFSFSKHASLLQEKGGGV